MNELNFSMYYLMTRTIHFIVAMVLVNIQVVQFLITGKTEIVQKTSNLNFTFIVRHPKHTEQSSNLYEAQEIGFLYQGFISN